MGSTQRNVPFLTKAFSDLRRRTVGRVIVFGVVLLGAVSATWLGVRGIEPEPSRANKKAAEAAQGMRDVPVKLTRRKDNGPYGTSAYNFRQQSQDLAIHHNQVDVVFNGCGHLHINPHAGTRSRIIDLGAKKLADVSPDNVKQPPNARWQQFSVVPQVNHVYLQESVVGDDRMLIVFQVTKVAAEVIELSWKSLSGDERDRAYGISKITAGTMGQCGGNHAAL